MRSAILLLFVAAVSALADDPLTYRELPCRVVDENGQPVPGLTVFLGGLDRDYQPYMADDEREEAPSDSKFTTDAKGCFTVRFGRFHFYDQAARIAGDAVPGYGRFCLLATRKGSAGAVSRLIVNPSDEAPVYPRSSSEAETVPEERQEWRWGEFAPLVLTDTAPAKPLDIVLKRGLEIRGRMVDTLGQPVRGRNVELGQDLHYGSHTGAGGEIFEQATTTDGAGRFCFRHVYPNRFQINPGWEGQPVRWVRTRVRRTWTDGIVDEIDPRTGGEGRPADYERSIALRIVAETRLRRYRYFGRVTDERGNPAAGMSIYMQLSSRLQPANTYGDGLASERTRTDSQGNYSIEVVNPHADFLYGDDGTNFEGGAEAKSSPLAPGRYDLVLHPKKSGE